MTYKLELFLVLYKKKKKLINIKSFKNYVFYDLLIFRGVRSAMWF